MFYLETKDKKAKFTIIYIYIYSILIIIPCFITGLVTNLIWISNKNINANLINICLISILITSSSISYIIFFVKNIKWRKMMIYEFRNIIKNVRLPKKLPKVVYVYTTYNDFWKERLLQNMQQTYSNIEYWISVGDPNDQYLDEIKAFAKKHKVKIIIMDYLSKSKADNLNYFLKHAKTKFDYLLIGDPDVAFEKTFVENSLKLFYSDRALNLGYVSSTLMNYRGDNVFTNAFLHFDNEKYILGDQIKNFSWNSSPNLYSACCLISSKLLLENNFQFPDSNLEDWYLEKFANKNFWVGIVSPLNVAMQSFDKTIWHNLNRISRLFTWGIKYQKEQHFIKYNEKYERQNNIEFATLFLGFFFILGFIFSGVFLTNLIINWQIILKNSVIIVFIINIVISLILILITKGYFLSKITKTDKLKKSFLQPFYGICLLTWLLFQWVNSLFFNKYKSFDKSISKIKLKWIWLSIALSVFAITLFNFLFFYFGVDKYNVNWFYLYVFFNMILGYILFFNISLLILIRCGQIKSNKDYDKSKFVYCTNNYAILNEVEND